jgi:hypothetical protein
MQMTLILVLSLILGSTRFSAARCGVSRLPTTRAGVSLAVW